MNFIIEIPHAVDEFLDDAGIRSNIEDPDEAYAYLTGYLTTEIYPRRQGLIHP